MRAPEEPEGREVGNGSLEIPPPSVPGLFGLSSDTSDDERRGGLPCQLQQSGFLAARQCARSYQGWYAIKSEHDMAMLEDKFH